MLVIWETFKHSECQVRSIAQGVELALAGWKNLVLSASPV